MRDSFHRLCSMQTLFAFFLSFSILFSAAVAPVHAQEDGPRYSTGSVVRVLEQREIIPSGLALDGTGEGQGGAVSESSAAQRLYVQQLEVLDSNTGELVIVEHGTEFIPVEAEKLLRPGDQLVLAVSVGSQESQDGQGQQATAQIADMHRLPALLWILGGFFVLVVAVSGWRGGLSIVGMGVSLVVLAGFVVPQIVAGQNPLTISIFGALVIAVITVYLSHGFSIKSHLALLSMMVTLVAVALLAQTAVSAAQLTGFGSEEASFLAYGATATINLQGLLLGGILLGALGVLDDICVSQISTVIELRRANAKWKFYELYQAGMRVGRDHVASLVNTLVLAYAGANLPLFILFSLANSTPAWVHLNSELLAEEIVRTLVGSIGLVLAVPLTTLLVSFWATRTKKLPSADLHNHVH